MRLFRHVTTEYTCAECGRACPVVSPTLSPFFFIAVALAAIPFWIATVREPWGFPWYSVVFILTGELLLLTCAGLITTVLFMFDPRATSRCRHCQAPMILRGRHFEPAGSHRPHRIDLVLLVIFIALNAAAWWAYCAAMPDIR